MRILVACALVAACSAETGFSSIPDAYPPASTEESTVPSDAPDRPDGLGLVQVTPDPLSLGEVWVGCEGVGQFTVTNIGDSPVRVQELSLDGASFGVGRPPLPQTLEVGVSLLVDVGFSPELDGPDAAELTIQTDAGVARAIAEGNGMLPGRVSQSFDVPMGLVDLIFIVDQSSSMDPFQIELIRNLETFITDLEGAAGDWQLVVANRDDGCNTTGILTADTPDYQEIFQTRVQQGSGLWIGDHPTLPDREAMLTIGANAADQAAPGRCNDGLLRPDAQLHVVVVSDERDHSDANWTAYVERMQLAKGDPSLVTVSAFVDASWDNDEGYRQAVAATGGVQAPITAATWAPFMPALAAHSIPDASFLLDDLADPDSIVVEVNGVETSEWRWEATAREVVVDSIAATLVAEDEVTVWYDQVAACD